MEVDRGEGDRPWEELIPDALALIFKKMSFQEMLTVVPAVCKSWRKAAMQPDCWQEIDIEDWCRRCKPENMDRMVQMLVSRSRGSMRKLAVFGLTSDLIFAFIAKCAHSLRILRIPRSEVTDSLVSQVAPKLATLLYLDISYCEKITSSSLEALGMHCMLLRRLNMNMFPQFTSGQSPRDDEAIAIARHMSRLKHLELAYGLLTDSGVEAILSMCKELEHLDVRGCWALAMKDDLVQQCHKLKFFTGPDIHDSDYDDIEEFLSYDDDDYDALSMSIHDYDYYESLFDEDPYGSDEMYFDEDSNESDDGWDDLSVLGAYVNETAEDMEMPSPRV